MDQRLQKILALARAGPETKRRAATGLLTEVRDTGSKGSGIFALEDVQPGTLLAIDTPIMLFNPKTYTEKDVIAAKSSLPADERTRYESLYVGESMLAKFPFEVARYSQNAFELDKDLVGIALAMSRLNHSCTPCAAMYNDKDRMMLHAVKMIKKGEEITVAYQKLPRLQRDERIKELEKRCAFTCICHTCSNFGESDQRRSKINDQLQPIPNWDTPDKIIERLEGCVETMKEEFGEYGVSDKVYEELAENHERLGNMGSAYNFALDRLAMNAICSGIDSECFSKARQQMEQIAEKSAEAQDVMRELHNAKI